MAEKHVSVGLIIAIVLLLVFAAIVIAFLMKIGIVSKLLGGMSVVSAVVSDILLIFGITRG